MWLHRCTSHFSLIGLHRFHAFGVFNTLRIFSLIGLLGNAHLASSTYLRLSHLLLNWFRFRSLGIFNFSPLRFRHTAFSQHLWFQALGIFSGIRLLPNHGTHIYLYTYICAYKMCMDLGFNFATSCTDFRQWALDHFLHLAFSQITDLRHWAEDHFIYLASTYCKRQTAKYGVSFDIFGSHVSAEKGHDEKIWKYNRDENKNTNIQP